MKGLVDYAMLLAACLSAAQTSQEFHFRYGDSDTERFKIRDGIDLTVEYGSDGSACQMEIKPHSFFCPTTTAEVHDTRCGRWNN
jgi:hypothetical protein